VLLDFFLVTEVRRFARSLTVALRLSTADPRDDAWVRVVGTIDAWDDADGPFLLGGESGAHWVDAGLTHTFFATPSTPALGDRVQVIGRLQPFPDDGAYRQTQRRTLSGDPLAPLTVIAPTWHPVRWILVEAGLSLLAALAYLACFVPLLFS
jgi:hypothetical protein